jgi:hypothetical protein
VRSAARHPQGAVDDRGELLTTVARGAPILDRMTIPTHAHPGDRLT